ncbi:GHKL domain-containing protein [Qiania dongpingensis]|uniref:GHKL domain-containing protein n=1 Tax=Qiania dongpingensis TaxID=2763669 RepID=A0A7G9G3E1_9FIRM|nr:GHKL domain-containing protein [Qiania dongpingensis]QNM05323.1 GHKL domain-containing protein [Qiania dongpingensis]
MRKIHKRHFLSSAPAAAALLIFSLLLALAYRADNKYTAGPPYGENGVFAFSESDLGRPLFLIDGWLLDGQEVFIGQYSNFSYLSERNSPFGTGTYTLTLRYEGAPRILLLEIPTIFTQYTLYINGVPAVTDGDGTQAAVPVGGPDTLLTLETVNQDHYYSGLTYPPALGTPEEISRLFFIRTLCYTAVCFSGLTLALFSAAVWLSKYRDKLFFHFGLLCLAFSVYCAHPLIWQAGAAGRLWYAAEDSSWLFVLAQAVHLAALSAHLEREKWYRRALRPFLLAACLFTAFSVLVLIPADGGFVKFYGFFTDWYKLFVWAVLAVLTGIGLYRKNSESAALIMGAAAVLGVSVLIDLWDSNMFEPIRGLWQNEYAGVLLVLLFAVMMVRRILSLLRESRELQTVSLQYRFAAESAAQMQKNARQVRAMKHELNHHIEALSALCKEGSLPRLEEYLRVLRNEKNALPSLYYSGHFLINAMLCSYLEPARQKGIKVDCLVLVPDQLAFSDAELCTLLSNLLQNAVEACTSLPREVKPYIRFEMSLNGNLLSFLCVNSAGPGKSSGPFPTTKQDSQNHGLGLPAIARITEKYSGAMSAVKENGTFTVRGILSLPSSVS